MKNPDFGTLLHQLVSSNEFKVLLYLWAADYILGVVAALYTRTFVLSRFAETLRTDGLKMFAWFVMFSAGVVASSFELLGVIDLGTVANALAVALSASFVGSILKSIADFGVDLPTTVAGNDPSN